MERQEQFEDNVLFVNYGFLIPKRFKDESFFSFFKSIESTFE